MDRLHISTVANKFQSVFNESTLNELGKEVRFCRRQRFITPFRLALSLNATCATQRVETLADFQRSFNALFDANISYKAFYNQLAKPHFADFIRHATAELISEMTLKVLGFEKGDAFSEFKRIVIQDGSSFAIDDALREVFPGRFKTVKPAAVELHTTMDLLCDAPTCIVLTPDTASEQAFLPEVAELQGSLLLADRGYLDFNYLSRLIQHGAAFIIRAKSGLNPYIQDAFDETGKRLRALCGRELKAVHQKLPKRRRVELRVSWQLEDGPLCLRMIVSWNRQTKSFCYLLSNLEAEHYSLDTICRAYKWRWQVELLFKEWKSYANLHAFETTSKEIVEGLIWVAISAAALKRFLAYATQVLTQVCISTRKVAMCARHVLDDIFCALRMGDIVALRRALKAAITYLSANAKRAHPERDRRTGRFQLGLEPLFDNDDLIVTEEDEMDEAA